MDAPGGSVDSAPPRVSRAVTVLMSLAALAAGLLVGRSAAIEWSRGGFGGLAAIATIMIASVVALGVAAAVLILARLQFGRAGIMLRPIALSLVAFFVGIFLGQRWASSAGELYRPPVTLHAAGTAEAELSGIGVAFAPSGSGTAECSSGPNSEVAIHLSAGNLGRLGQGVVRAAMDLSGSFGARPGHGALFIGGEDQMNGTSWTGEVRIVRVDQGGLSGMLTFSGMRRTKFSGPADSSPYTISGSIAWACGPWASPESR